jgi:group I intron endonuclease
MINGKIYVGKTVEPGIRWTTHKSIAKGGKDKYPEKYFAIHAAISKYGSDNFIFNVAEYYHNNDSLNEAEKYWIANLKEHGVLLYNETSGGDGATPGIKFTEEHKRKISEARMGYKASIEARANMSKARKYEFAGIKNNKAKINEVIVKEIRLLYATGNYTHRVLAKMFNLTHATVGKIIRYELWSHII